MLPPNEVCLRLLTIEWPTLDYSSVAPMTATLRGRKNTSSGGLLRMAMVDFSFCSESMATPTPGDSKLTLPDYASRRERMSGLPGTSPARDFIGA